MITKTLFLKTRALISVLHRNRRRPQYVPNPPLTTKFEPITTLFPQSQPQFKLTAPKGRLVRLIPSSTTDPSRLAMHNFFNHRLASDPTLARTEWLDIVEARHRLWSDISSAKQELIRSFLNFLNLEIVKRARPTSVFNFGGASVGNLFLTGYVRS